MGESASRRLPYPEQPVGAEATFQYLGRLEGLTARLTRAHVPLIVGSIVPM